jgi:multidrug efflux pump subunit AcrB
VNKNAILLVDRINHLRELGMARSDAISEAGAQRLRPIVMTTAPMAVAIIGGLITSTALSLIVIPVTYTIFDDWVHRGKRRYSA